MREFRRALLPSLLITSLSLVPSYFAHRLFGLAFAPFLLLDWLTRWLPGGLMTAGIELLVKAIRALGLGPTSVVAKGAEQALAVMIALTLGTVVGALLGLVRRGRMVSCVSAGLAGGVALGQLAPDGASAVWLLAISLTWGLAIAWTSQHTSLQVEAAGRRRFIVRLGSATATVLVLGAAVELLLPRRRGRTGGGLAWSKTHELPNADAAVQPVAGTRPELTPVDEHYRIDINAVPPRVDEAQWRLHVSGLVARPKEFTLEELRAFEPVHRFVTLECISNPLGGDLIGTTRWTGVSLQRLLPELELLPEATHLRIDAADGFFEYVALETLRTDERCQLCYAWDGLPLTREHGFPLRIYLPDRFGMKQPKWITSLRAVSGWEPGYWVERGWSREALMKATSVIDTIVPGRTQVSLGGIAFGGARGVSRVEVRADGGPWTQAQLRTPLSGTTWVIWRAEWPFAPGEHVFEVRCTDGEGRPQPVEPAEPHPDGASGVFRIRRRVGES